MQVETLFGGGAPPGASSDPGRASRAARSRCASEPMEIVDDVVECVQDRGHLGVLPELREHVGICLEMQFGDPVEFVVGHMRLDAAEGR